MTACYESPEVIIVLSKEEIHKRYQDTAMIIFKEQQSKKKEIVSYLSFGNSRRTMEYSNNGNHPVIIRKSESTIMQNSHLSSRTSIEYHKLDERCAIT
ncbi:uncharacterized protein [Mycetomoellerius zeteki]|uniref:uncharacterized protein n=1 Tax=Mycetomoellerius zeteki TaxID=64791 RepID=UPI00084E5EE4|nr:PREDICTED: uncharacterized protein LOC108730519 [Trachymyrmex zeteki]XP_018315771.1 PREDICTED: uncharacterized protein LOC108730519 [Trachymyrmex zeteki]XP_018315772.1 PREDICTED: uncharacterized protein LOC108730519 [Trachymyrmex zeteki]XP_018315773.1 PREDICTED: uncharacterized protein LOC108730519 [Trachymyrmex zeteki]XP_018315774.1 PREDICTED: uncharacterized protein LOC108730519 [Trachymyrmex zeteki]XP_018315775.1 PREDICTED: uncharacterized protein LOC108730519 [Trachymyrmex zeteki]XP_01